MNRPLPGRDVPLGRPRPATAGRSGALSLLAFPKATRLDDKKPQTVRLWPDGDTPSAFALASVGQRAGHPYLDTEPSHSAPPRLPLTFRG